MRKYWTPQEIEQLKKMYQTEHIDTITKHFNVTRSQIYNAANKYGFKRPDSYLFEHVYDITPNVETQFKKGHSSWNKGMKGLQIGGEATRFKKGMKPHNWRPDGSQRLDKDGFTMIKINGKYVLKHRYIYEQEHGKIPKGHCVAFKDGNKSNIRIDNLELITFQENMKRNSVHNLPEEIKEVIRAKSTLNKIITHYGKKQN